MPKLKIITGGQPRVALVDGWPGYFITEWGVVLTTRSNSGKVDRPPRPMIPQPNKTGHLRVALLNRGKRKTRFVHHLVLEAFVGLCPSGLVARHLDGVPNNNHLDNLKWDTSSKNRLDMREHGTMPRGEALHSSKLTEADVVEMRERFSTGDVDVQDLAADYGVDPTTVSNALRGKWWAHVGGPVVVSCRPRGDRHWRRKTQ